MEQRWKEDDTGYKGREVWSQVGKLGIQKCTDLCFFISKLNIPLRRKRTGLRRMELALYWQGYLLQSKQPATSPELELFLLFSIQFFFVLFFVKGKIKSWKIRIVSWRLHMASFLLPLPVNDEAHFQSFLQEVLIKINVFIYTARGWGQSEWHRNFLHCGEIYPQCSLKWSWCPWEA